jgi:hypothetical protein
MKLTTIALASVLAITPSMAFAQGADSAGGGGETAAGAAGSSSVGSSTSTGTTGMSNGVTTGSSIGLSGFSTGTYPTLATPGGFPSALPAPGVVISR